MVMQQQDSTTLVSSLHFAPGAPDFTGPPTQASVLQPNSWMMGHWSDVMSWYYSVQQRVVPTPQLGQVHAPPQPKYHAEAPMHSPGSVLAPAQSKARSPGPMPAPAQSKARSVGLRGINAGGCFPWLGGNRVAGQAAPKSASVSANGSPAPSFAIGDVVCYWSVTLREWVKSKVISVNHKPNGEIDSYDLTAKSAAEVTRVRDGSTPSNAPPPHLASYHPAASTATSFEVGDQVEYWSHTKRRWVDDVVHGKRTRNGAIVYDLDCKKGAELDSLRRRRAEQYQVGDRVEYWSNNQSRWALAKVLKVYQDAPHCDLDIKPGARLNRLRRARVNAAPVSKAASGAIPAFGASVARPVIITATSRSGATALQARRREDPGTSSARTSRKRSAGETSPQLFNAGDIVEYWSDTKLKWVITTVEARSVSSDGDVMYKLGCKPDASAAKVRAASAPVERYEVGEAVEYHSSSRGEWFPGTVVRILNNALHCDLDIKKTAPIARMRRRLASVSRHQGIADSADQGNNRPLQSGAQKRRRVEQSATQDEQAKERKEPLEVEAQQEEKQPQVMDQQELKSQASSTAANKQAEVREQAEARHRKQEDLKCQDQPQLEELGSKIAQQEKAHRKEQGKVEQKQRDAPEEDTVKRQEQETKVQDQEAIGRQEQVVIREERKTDSRQEALKHQDQTEVQEEQEKAREREDAKPPEQSKFEKQPKELSQDVSQQQGHSTHEEAHTNARIGLQEDTRSEANENASLQQQDLKPKQKQETEDVIQKTGQETLQREEKIKQVREDDEEATKRKEEVMHEQEQQRLLEEGNSQRKEQVRAQEESKHKTHDDEVDSELSEATVLSESVQVAHRHLDEEAEREAMRRAEQEAHTYAAAQSRRKEEDRNQAEEKEERNAEQSRIRESLHEDENHDRGRDEQQRRFSEHVPEHSISKATRHDKPSAQQHLDHPAEPPFDASRREEARNLENRKDPRPNPATEVHQNVDVRTIEKQKEQGPTPKAEVGRNLGSESGSHPTRPQVEPVREGDQNRAFRSEQELHRRLGARPKARFVKNQPASICQETRKDDDDVQDKLEEASLASDIPRFQQRDTDVAAERRRQFLRDAFDDSDRDVPKQNRADQDTHERLRQGGGHRDELVPKTSEIKDSSAPSAQQLSAGLGFGSRGEKRHLAGNTGAIVQDSTRKKDGGENDERKQQLGAMAEEASDAEGTCTDGEFSQATELASEAERDDNRNDGGSEDESEAEESSEAEARRSPSASSSKPASSPTAIQASLRTRTKASGAPPVVPVSKAESRTKTRRLHSRPGRRESRTSHSTGASRSRGSKPRDQRPKDCDTRGSLHGDRKSEREAPRRVASSSGRQRDHGRRTAGVSSHTHRRHGRRRRGRAASSSADVSKSRSPRRERRQSRSKRRSSRHFRSGSAPRRRRQWGSSKVEAA